MLEQFKNIPIYKKIVYYQYDTNVKAHRGFHAHKALKQVLGCVHGSCKVLLDNGSEKEVVELNKPNFGLYLESNVQREMFDFTEDAVLMVLASELYDESEYIRNYDEFLKYLEENK